MRNLEMGALRLSEHLKSKKLATDVELKSLFYHGDEHFWNRFGERTNRWLANLESGPSASRFFVIEDLESGHLEGMAFTSPQYALDAYLDQYEHERDQIIDIILGDDGFILKQLHYHSVICKPLTFESVNPDLSKRLAKATEQLSWPASAGELSRAFKDIPVLREFTFPGRGTSINGSRPSRTHHDVLQPCIRSVTHALDTLFKKNLSQKLKRHQVHDALTAMCGQESFHHLKAKEATGQSRFIQPYALSDDDPETGEYRRRFFSQPSDALTAVVGTARTGSKQIHIADNEEGLNIYPLEPSWEVTALPVATPERPYATEYLYSHPNPLSELQTLLAKRGYQTIKERVQAKSFARMIILDKREVHVRPSGPNGEKVLFGMDLYFAGELTNRQLVSGASYHALFWLERLGTSYHDSQIVVINEKGMDISTANPNWHNPLEAFEPTDGRFLSRSAIEIVLLELAGVDKSVQPSPRVIEDEKKVDVLRIKITNAVDGLIASCSGSLGPHQKHRYSQLLASFLLPLIGGHGWLPPLDTFAKALAKEMTLIRALDLVSDEAIEYGYRHPLALYLSTQGMLTPEAYLSGLQEGRVPARVREQYEYDVEELFGILSNLPNESFSGIRRTLPAL